MAEFPYEPSLRFDIFLANTLHDGLYLPLCIGTPAQEVWVTCWRFVLPTGVETVPGISQNQ